MKFWLTLACLLGMIGEGFCQYSQIGGGVGTGSHTIGGWTFDSRVLLPQVWVNGIEWQGTTSNVINFPSAWVCGGGTSYGPYTNNVLSSLQQALNDAEACRTATGSGTQINVPAGAFFSAGSGLSLNQTLGDTSTNFIVLTSTSPLPVGVTACSHGIQDNIPESQQPGLRNLGCTGSALSYYLGTTSYTISPGAFTLANGTQVNTSQYNDIAQMYTVEMTGNGNRALYTGPADASGQGPHHYAVLNGEFRPLASIPSNSGIIKMGQDTETAESQIPNHIHMAYLYVHGDCGDAPVSGGVAIGTAFCNNVISNNWALTCIYCSISYSYMDKTTRVGAEGHGIGINLGKQLKFVHNWFEGQSIGHICGGFAQPITILNFMVCQDMEDRANRYTYPYSWMLAWHAGFRMNAIYNTTGGAGTGATIHVTAAQANAMKASNIQNGGSGYAVNNLLTLTNPYNSAATGTVLVTAVTSGAVTATTIVSGTGYHVANGLATTGGTGTGATVNITSVSPTGGITGVTLASGGTGYGAANNLTVVQSGGSGGTVGATGASAGVLTGVTVISGSGFVINSWGRKNAHEYKFSDRILLDGNIFENADYSGAQGTTISFKTAQNSDGIPGINYWTSLSNSTITNNVIRTGCNGTSMGNRSAALGSGLSSLNGNGVSMNPTGFNYLNNLMYNIGMQGPNVIPGCVGSVGPYAVRIAVGPTGSQWTGSVYRDSAGLTSTLVLDGAGRGYTTGTNLATVAATGSGTGATVNITSVNAWGQITGVTVASPGTGYAKGNQITVTQAGTTATGTITVQAIAGGTTTGPVGNFVVGPSSTGVSGFSVGEPVVVGNCTDPSFNTAATVPPQLTLGPLVLPGTQTFGLIVVYPNVGTANASATGCNIYNLQGTPFYVTVNHVSDFMSTNTNNAGDYSADTGSPNVYTCTLAMYTVFTNSVTVGGGPFASSVGEGTRTMNCATDPNSLTYNHNAIPDRDSYVQCPGHGAAGIPGGIAICYTEYANGVATFPPQTLWGVTTRNCVGNDPTTEDCLGIVGNMSTSTFNYVLPNYHQFRLCHTGDAACNGHASPFAAGGARQASDGTDLGVNFSLIDAHQILTQYPVPGSYPDY